VSGSKATSALHSATVARGGANRPTPRPAFTVPDRTAAGPAYLLGQVTQTIRTSAGVVQPVTQLGNETWLPIVRRNGRIGTALVATPSGQREAKVDLAQLVLRWTASRVDIDLSDLQLSVLRGNRVLGRFKVAAGGPGTPTPSGTFFVTDRVIFPPSSPYGDFALGLSVNQKQPTPGWTGGDQVAIHGTSHPETIGTYASLGCVRVGADALKVLFRAMPLGAPVTIHA
jgi:lipoprotein-anchoring transpeptidase ErfK/SrfK